MNQSRGRNLGWSNRNRAAKLTGIVKSLDPITQTLNNGDNTITHNLGKVVHSFNVKDGSTFIEVSGNDIDVNNFNINLAGGGSILDATIYINYK